MTPAQIKFRGFRMDGKGWVIGSLIRDVRSMYIAEEGTHIWTSFIPKEDESYHKQIRLIVHEIHPSSLGMFTGRTDKNGKEIFGAIGERGGDIIKYNGITSNGREIIRVVIYVPERSQFMADMYSLYCESMPIPEIIGNQWEVE